MSDLKPCPFCGSDAEHWFSTRNGLNLTNLGGAILHGEKRKNELIHTLKYIIRTADFELLNRLEVRDNRTGKIWR